MSINKAIDELSKAGAPRELRILDRAAGDLKFTWDPANDAEVELAREQFKAAKAKGMVAYRVKKGGARGETMREFDADAEAIIMAPAPAGG